MNAHLLYEICKKVVEDNIDHQYIIECGFNTLAGVYHAEYGNYRGKSSFKCKEYLMGLPTVCTIPFWNNEIIDIVAEGGYTIPEDEDKLGELVDAYWRECGIAFYNLIK